MPIDIDPQTEFAVARQPILGRGDELMGYELLYRNTRTSDGVAASARVLMAALGDIGLDRLVGSAPAFFNVSREYLLAGEPVPVHPERVVLELLEDQHVDAALLESMRSLRDEGFRFALDDFVYSPEFDPLLHIAWAVKLDVRALSDSALQEHVEFLKRRGLKLIAEKIETRDEHERCLALGFDGFQGYFFTRPSSVGRAVATTMNVGAVRELLALGAEAPLEELERLIMTDAGLSVRLLRLANSAFVSPASRISSVRHALMLLGPRTVWRWALVLCLADVGDHPHQLLVTALERARLCELVAASAATADRAAGFTAGLLSVADALLNLPMADVVVELGLDDRLAAALLKHSGPEGRALDATLAHEAGAELNPAGWAAAGWADEFAGAFAAG